MRVRVCECVCEYRELPPLPRTPATASLTLTSPRRQPASFLRPALSSPPSSLPCCFPLPSPLFFLTVPFLARCTHVPSSQDQQVCVFTLVFLNYCSTPSRCIFSYYISDTSLWMKQRCTRFHFYIFNLHHYFRGRRGRVTGSLVTFATPESVARLVGTTLPQGRAQGGPYQPVKVTLSSLHIEEPYVEVLLSRVCL